MYWVVCSYIPFASFCSGNTLVTVATGEIGQADAERAGLVPTHAYAVLNIVEVQVGA